MKALGTTAAALLVAAMLTIATLPTSASASTTVVPADADSFVLSTSPNSNRGAATSLKVRNSTKITYVRFTVPGLSTGEVVSGATLRVYATSPGRCALGVEVLRAANDTWGEKTIRWSNQPGPTGSVLATLAWTTRGSYRDFDVTPAVLGAGPVSFLLRHAPGCNVTSDVALNSREAGSNPPQLVVETTTTSPPPAPACSDGLDNDSDGLTDYPADPGCIGATDDDETDPLPGVVVATAGDIVCDPASSSFDGSQPAVCQHRATADLLSGADAVLPLGDLQYPGGALEHFMAGYDPSWGQHAPATYPAVGNHEYHVPGAQGYFDYWASKGRPTGGIGAGYYVVDIGSWRLIALNSNCAAVPCTEGMPQNDFLELALAPPTPSCMLAYWHHPLFNSGTVHGSAMPSGAKAFWDDLYAAGADIVLNGHEHNYQRYAKQDPAGQAAPNGIREFVVGTGGRSHYGLLDVKDANYEFGNATDFGVLRLSLGEDSYSWEFVALNGVVLDSGGPVSCN
ncbi:MAG: DNRLRE domain-containing protein [Actinomycetota bacterium]|nr:DNRLRE domain-containing protein [Actinomycetota bacterium]